MTRALASILALDLGTRCGWALLHDGREESGVQTFDIRRGESPGMRYVFFNRWLAQMVEPLLEACARGHLVILAYEQTHQRGGAATEVAAGFATRVQEYAARYQLQHVALHTATLKKWTTGNGRAGKPEMLEAITRRGWLPARADPTKPETYDEALTDDEADALALLHYVEAEIIGRRGRA